jgi:hypothetical protein
LEEWRGLGGNTGKKQQTAERSGESLADAEGFHASWSITEGNRRRGPEEPLGNRLPDWAGGTLRQPNPVTCFEVAEALRNVCGVSDGLAAGLVRRGGDIEYEVTGDGYRILVRERVKRLRVLGNGWVPQAAVLALETLLGMVNQT